MDIGVIFETASKLGALGVALLALKWAREDKASSVKLFESLNDERKQLQNRANDFIEKSAIEMALVKDKVNTLIAEIAALKEKILSRRHGDSDQ